LIQGRPARGAEPFEAGQLRLYRDAGRSSTLDQRAAVGGDRGAGALGGVSRGAELGPGPVPGELRRVGVET